MKNKASPESLDKIKEEIRNSPLWNDEKFKQDLNDLAQKTYDLETAKKILAALQIIIKIKDLVIELETLADEFRKKNTFIDSQELDCYKTKKIELKNQISLLNETLITSSQRHQRIFKEILGTVIGGLAGGLTDAALICAVALIIGTFTGLSSSLLFTLASVGFVYGAIMGCGGGSKISKEMAIAEINKENHKLFKHTFSFFEEKIKNLPHFKENKQFYMVDSKQARVENIDCEMSISLV